MKLKLRYVWQTLIAVGYLAVAVGVVSIARTRFETVALAVLVQLYAAVLSNFSLLGETLDSHNYAGLVRFRILAKAQGVSGDEYGNSEQQERILAETLANGKPTIVIHRLGHAAVSLYSLFKIIQALFF